MTTKILRGTYSAGYDLAQNYSGLRITRHAQIGGTGVYAAQNATIVNAGTVAAAQGAPGGPGYYAGHLGYDGVRLAGGRLVNHGAIYAGQGGTGATSGPLGYGYGGGAGGQGVLLAHAGLVSNSGAISGGAGGLPGNKAGGGGAGGFGVLLLSSGTVQNTGRIAGGVGGGSPVFSGAGGYGVAILGYGDALTNQGGTILGGDGGAGGGGQAANQSNGASAVLIVSGDVVNSGLIMGGDGGSAYSGSGRSGSYGGDGVFLRQSGLIRNTGTIAGGRGGAGGGSTGDGGAGGGGGFGVYLSDVFATTTVNSGTIVGGAGGAGGASGGGGTGGAGGRGGASVVMPYGYGYGDIVNCGAIIGGAGGAGGHGSGGHGKGGAGGDGVLLSNGATVANFGTIAGGASGGGGAEQGDGIVLTGASTISNARAAIISGQIGVAGGRSYGLAVVRLTNGGLIEGATYSVQFNGRIGNDVIAQSGARFVGEVDGGRNPTGGYYKQGGEFELAGGVETLTGLGGQATLSGAVTADLERFGTYVVNDGVSLTLSGSNALGAAQGITVYGFVSVSGGLNEDKAGSITVGGGGALDFQGLDNALNGTVINDGLIKTDGGTVTVRGDVTGSGVVVVRDGTLSFAAAFNQAVAFAGVTGALELAHSQSFTAAVSGLAVNGAQSLDLDDIGFVDGGEATFSGTATSGVLTVSDGTHVARITLDGDYLGSTFVASSNGEGGTVVVAQKADGFAGPAHVFIATMAAFGAPGGQAVHSELESTDRGVLLTSPRVAIA